MSDPQVDRMTVIGRRWRYIGGPHTTTAEETIEPVGPVRKWPEEGEELVPANELRGAVHALRYVAGEDVPGLDGPYAEVAREALRALGIITTGGQ